MRPCDGLVCNPGCIHPSLQVILGEAEGININEFVFIQSQV